MKYVTTTDFEEFTPETFPLTIRHAREYFSDWVDWVQQPESSRYGWKTNMWPKMNQYFGGLRNELVVLSGDTGKGKTTFALNWVKDMLDQNRTCTVLSLEDGPRKSIRALSKMILGHREPYTHEEQCKLGHTLDTWPLYLLDYKGMLSERLAEKAILYAQQKCNANLIVIDHLEYLQKELHGRSENYAIDDCVRMISGHTEKCTILLLCHPKKRNDSSTPVTLDDLKGTSGIAQTARSVLIHYRPKKDSDITWLTFAKIHDDEYSQNTNGRLTFFFNNASRTYIESTEELRWND